MGEAHVWGPLHVNTLQKGGGSHLVLHQGGRTGCLGSTIKMPPPATSPSDGVAIRGHAAMIRAATSLWVQNIEYRGYEV